MNSKADVKHTEVERFQMIYDKDNVELLRLGKRPVLKASEVVLPNDHGMPVY